MKNNRNNIKTFTNKKYYAFFILFLITLIACGKKGDPTLKSYEKPDPPLNVYAFHRESSIIINWTYDKSKQKNIKAFHIFRTNNDKFENIATLPPEIRSFTDKEIKNDTLYKYKIVSQSLKDVLSKDSNVIEIRTINPPPPPENIRVEIQNDKVILRWDKAQDNVYYNVYKSFEKEKYNLIPINKEPIKENYFTDKLDITRPVFYTVRGLMDKSIRNEGAASKEIVLNPSELIPPTPKNLQVVIKPDSVYLIWKECDEPWVIGYKIYRQTDTEKDYKLIGETKIPSFIDKEPPLSKRAYRVTSISPYKESQPVEIKDISYKKRK
jgi:fibronectin type 3 domain-containing protein